MGNYKVITTGYELCSYSNIYEVEADTKEDAKSQVVNNDVPCSNECETIDYTNFDESTIEAFNSGEDKMVVINSIEPMLSLAQSIENERVQKLNELNLKLSRLTGEPPVITEPTIIVDDTAKRFCVETIDYSIVLLEVVYNTTAKSKEDAKRKVLNGEVERNDWRTVNHTDLNKETLKPFVSGKTKLQEIITIESVKSCEEVIEEKKQANIQRLKDEIKGLL